MNLFLLEDMSMAVCIQMTKQNYHSLYFMIRITYTNIVQNMPWRTTTSSPSTPPPPP